MARLYLSLVNPEMADLPSARAKDIEPVMRFYEDLHKIMVDHPQLVGGTGRIDTNIMLGKSARFNFADKAVAKQGAEGLLAIGIPASRAHPSGLGIIIKLASGFVERHMELITQELFKQLRLVEDQPTKPDDSQPHLKTIFHFQVKQ